MIAQYEPLKGIKIGEFELKWNSKRENIRLLINEPSEIDDSKQFSNQYQDVYSSIGKNKCLIFLQYNNREELIGIIIHYGLAVEVNSEIFSFENNLHQQLKDSILPFDYLDENEIYFRNLNMSIYNDIFMGGDGNYIGIIELSKD